MNLILSGKKNKRAKYYIRLSGGKVSKEASNSYVVLANGKTKRISFFSNPFVYPNSIIFTNRKIVKEKKEFAEQFSRIFGIIASTLTTILLVEKL